MSVSIHRKSALMGVALAIFAVASAQAQTYSAGGVMAPTPTQPTTSKDAMTDPARRSDVNGIGRDDTTNPKEEFKKAIAEFNAQRFTQAILLFEDVLEAAPDDPSSWTYKGLSELSINQFAAAQMSLKRALKIDNSLVLPRANLIIADIKLNQKAEAQAQFKTLQTQATRCRDTCKEAKDLKGYIGQLEPMLASN